MKRFHSLCLAALAATFASAAQAQDSFDAALLDEHNAARADVGLPGLAWNAELADQAADWARELARRGVMEHADIGQRRGAGENLWVGASGYFDARDMVSLFVAERRWYRHAAFPEVSTTGNWHDVGHYTQIIWRDTREVGCALAEGESEEFLVCRYWPAGNYMGQYAY